jgi:repressor LexA
MMRKKRFETLTEVQDNILQFIRTSIKENAMPPTYAEIARHFKFKSNNSVETHINALERKGYLKKLSNKSRGLVPVADELSMKPKGIPLVGTIAAGAPILAEENIEEYIDFQSFFESEEDVFALKVRGNSMIKVGIMDGDMVIIQKQNYVESGEIGAALVDGEATVKRIIVRKNGVALKPENDDYKELFIEADRQDFFILGKVIGVVRRL